MKRPGVGFKLLLALLIAGCVVLFWLAPGIHAADEIAVGLIYQ